MQILDNIKKNNSTYNRQVRQSLTYDEESKLKLVVQPIEERAAESNSSELLMFTVRAFHSCMQTSKTLEEWSTT